MAPLSIEYDLDILLIAVFATMVVVFAVALFSAYTSFDFTKCAIVAMVALGAFFLLAITSAIVWHFTRQPKWWNLAYGAIGVVLFVIVSSSGGGGSNFCFDFVVIIFVVPPVPRS